MESLTKTKPNPAGRLPDLSPPSSLLGERCCLQMAPVPRVPLAEAAQLPSDSGQQSFVTLLLLIPQQKIQLKELLLTDLTYKHLLSGFEYIPLSPQGEGRNLPQQIKAHRCQTVFLPLLLQSFSWLMPWGSQRWQGESP